MSRTVFCEYFKEEKEGLDFQLIPGETGERVFSGISKEAWALWQSKQTMLINENRLNMMKPEDQQFLQEQMVAFLFEGKDVNVEGYTPPSE